MLELQQYIEEKRLILGKKFENFLLKSLKNIGVFLHEKFAAKSCPFFATLFIVSVSVFARSTRDIGHNSGFLLNLVSINQILLAEFLVNLLGLLSIYFSFLILKKSEIAKTRFALNLLILSFSIGFFLRPFTLQFNDFITEYSVILAISFPIIAFCFKDLSRNFQIKNKKIFYGFVLSISLLLAFHSDFDLYGKKSLICSLLLPAIMMLAYRINFEKYINWKRDFVVLIFIIIAPQFDPQIFSKIVLNLGAFWWLMVLILAGKFRQNSASVKPILALLQIRFCKKFLGSLFFGDAVDTDIHEEPKNKLTTKFEAKDRICDSAILSFLVPYNFFSWLYFIALTALTIFLLSNKNTQEFAWFFSTKILILLIIFYQKFHEKISKKREFSTFSASAIFLIFSGIINLHLAAIFNFDYASNYKSPNQVSEQIAAISQHYAKGEITIISNAKSDVFPAANYIKNINPSSFLTIQNLYKNPANNQDLIKILSKKIGDEKNNVIIVKQEIESDKQCFVGFLEYYFYDAEFKKTFLQNYVFLTKITETKKPEKLVKFFSEDQEYVFPDSGDLVAREFEVYVRKK